MASSWQVHGSHRLCADLSLLPPTSLHEGDRQDIIVFHLQLGKLFGILQYGAVFVQLLPLRGLHCMEAGLQLISLTIVHSGMSSWVESGASRKFHLLQELLQL